MYIGYDNGGWFWQKYKGGNGDYYQQTRKPAPTKDQEVILSETKLRAKQVLGVRSVQMFF